MIEQLLLCVVQIEIIVKYHFEVFGSGLNVGGQSTDAGLNEMDGVFYFQYFRFGMIQLEKVFSHSGIELFDQVVTYK